MKSRYGIRAFYLFCNIKTTSSFSYSPCSPKKELFARHNYSFSLSIGWIFTPHPSCFTPNPVNFMHTTPVFALYSQTFTPKPRFHAKRILSGDRGCPFAPYLGFFTPNPATFTRTTPVFAPYSQTFTPKPRFHAATPCFHAKRILSEDRGCPFATYLGFFAKTFQFHAYYPVFFRRRAKLSRRNHRFTPLTHAFTPKEFSQRTGGCPFTPNPVGFTPNPATFTRNTPFFAPYSQTFTPKPRFHAANPCFHAKRIISGDRGCPFIPHLGFIATNPIFSKTSPSAYMHQLGSTPRNSP